MPKPNFKIIADYINDEHARRKRKRADLEEEWKEIDRQVSMVPDIGYKKNIRGEITRHTAWMPELELPLQAQTLEVTSADVRRMLFPDSGIWYAANAEMTDDYLEKHDFTSIIANDKNDVPTVIDQDGLNKLCEGVMAFWHRQYNVRANINQIIIEALKYSVGIGRCRIVTKRVFLNTAKGVVSAHKKLPVIFPISTKHTFLDDSAHYLMNEGEMLGPSVIFEKKVKILDLKLAAKAGTSGWRMAALRNMESDKNGEVTLLEMEGDLVLPFKTSGSIHVPNAIITIVKGTKNKKPVNDVVRFRLRDEPFSSYIEFPYHREHVDKPYGSSPLIKGWPIQLAATHALVRVMMAAQLNTLPPVQYDPDDRTFAQEGGPRIYPGAQWASSGDVKPHPIGDLNALLQIYIGLLQQYADVTGVNAPRLGAQTVSHTTAYAKEAELNRGVVRTVDFVKETLEGPLEEYLYKAYALGRKVFTDTSLFIDAYNGFVNIGKSHLPENVVWDAIGAGGPLEEQQKMQGMLNAMQQAMAMEQFKSLEAQGIPSTINIPEAQKELLRKGGWKDIDLITNTETVPTGNAQPPGMAGGAQASSAAPGAALQALEAV